MMLRMVPVGTVQKETSKTVMIKFYIPKSDAVPGVAVPSWIHGHGGGDDA